MAEEAKNNGGEGAVVPAQSHGSTGTAVGTAVISPDAVQNPGLPAHRKRVTDLDPKREKRAERTVYTLFYLSIAGSLGAVLAYMFFPIESGNLWDIRLHTMFVGLGMTLALLAVGIGAVHWGKALMADHESIDERHPVPSDEPTREAAAAVFEVADKESGFSRRTLVRNSLIGALIAFPIPGITPTGGANTIYNCVTNGEATVAVKEAQGDTLTSLVGLNFNYNSLDSVQSPRNGFIAELKPEFAGLGGDSKFLRVAADARYYREIFDDVVGFAAVNAFDVVTVTVILAPMSLATSLYADEVAPLIFLPSRFH